jgi:ABC-2 type transport system permease protein
MNLVRAELLKIRTIATWWVLGLITFVLWVLTTLANWAQTDSLLSLGSETMDGLTAEQKAQVVAQTDVANIAANLYTSGQFFGLMMVMLLGAIVVTNEFFHQTATTTFLTTANRTAVIGSKLIAATILGVVFWLVTTVFNLVVGSVLLSAYDVAPQLGEGAIWRAVGLNALAYAIWSVLGVGAGVLIRSQIGATITLTMVYLAGYFGAGILFALIGNRFGEWFQNLQVLVPPLASQLMITGTELPGSPPQWVGALVLIAYAVVTGLVGTLIVRRRDIS